MSGPALWSSQDATAATGGRSLRPWTASSVSIDSRTLAPGGLFVALHGPTFDGHDFVADALAKGAAAAIVSRMPSEVSIEAPLLIVADTLQALRDLGRAARQRTTARVIGVTGSVGKTGVKEALRAVLAAQASAQANEGSLNNHWGLPLSLARLDPGVGFGIFEMGMNHAGEIEPLTRLARPDVAVITTVEAVHRENFPSIEAIADAKAEIFAGVAAGGAAVLYRDNPHFPRLERAARAAGIERILSFSRGGEADARLIEAIADATGSTVRAEIAGEVLSYRLNVPGTHWVTNSLCVLAAVHAAGGDVAAAAAAFAGVAPAKGRGQRQELAIGGGTFVLIDDSYNASPVSMRAAFEVLGRQEPAAGGRRIAVLGDMLELGEEAPALHAGLAAPLQANGIERVFACGANMQRLIEALPPALRGGYAADAASLAPLVANVLRAGDIVTVKGSAGSRMRLVVDALQSLGAPVTAARSSGG